MFYLFVIGRALALALPRRAGYFLAIIFARLQFYLSKKDRKAIIYNLLPVVNDAERACECARAVLENFALYLVDFFRFSKMDGQFIKKYVKIQGTEYIDKLIAEKKGIISLSAHIGNYEFGAVVTSFLNYDTYVVALPHKDARTNNFFNRQRGVCNVKVIPTGIAVRKCVSLLDNGKLVAFLGDREFTPGAGKKVRLCNRLAYLPKGPFFFALKTQSAIVPTFLIRENKYFYRFIFEPEIPLKDNGSPKALETIVDEYAGILEKYIRKYPEQWYVFQEYWLNEDLGSNSRL